MLEELSIENNNLKDHMVSALDSVTNKLKNSITVSKEKPSNKQINLLLNDQFDFDYSSNALNQKKNLVILNKFHQSHSKSHSKSRK